jgi:Gamma-glutamyl cyclotransferase, AIG2-like
MSEAVLKVMLGRVPSWTTGTMTGYVRQPLCNRCYPGVVRRDRNTVRGRVLRDILPQELANLDIFEGDEMNKSLESSKRGLRSRQRSPPVCGE